MTGAVGSARRLSMDPACGEGRGIQDTEHRAGDLVGNSETGDAWSWPEGEDAD